MRLLSVFRKSFRESKRDLWVLLLSLAFAPLFVFIYWLITGGTGSTSYSVLVINRDQPAIQENGSTLAAGEEIIAGLRGLSYENGSPLLRIAITNDRSAAEKELRDRAAAVLIIIPEDFSARLTAFRSGEVTSSTEVTIIGDLTNPTYTVAAVMVMTVTDRYAQAVTNAPRPVNLIELPMGASAARTEFENYVPGLFIFSVIILIFQAAMTPARDIESGAMRRLRLTRLSALEYLGGTSLWLIMVAMVEVALTFAVSVAFGFRSQGSLWLAMLVTIITCLSVIGTGLIVACFSKTVSQAFVIANFPLGFLMFLTGSIFPLPRTTLFTIFGHGIAIYDFLPPTHAVIALNKIFTLGAGLKDVAFELVALTFLSVLYFGVGVWLFKRSQMR
jgi:ABC-2 type transport system permease protein